MRFSKKAKQLGALALLAIAHGRAMAGEPSILPNTKPFTYSRTWVLGKSDEEVGEYACSENNVDQSHLGFGPGPILPDGTRGFPEK